VKKKKVSKGIIFLMILVVFISFPIFKKANERTDEDNYIRVTVYSGDTLWKIASRYGSKDIDIRKTIYEIRKINKLDSVIIVPGQELLIPAK
jgi:nucleoid-associated protein YgaU